MQAQPFMLQEIQEDSFKDFLLSFDVLHVPEFLGGFLYDIIGKESDLKELEGCIQGTPMIRDEIKIAFWDYEKGGIDNDLQAILNFALVFLQLPSAMSTCDNLSPDILALKAYFSIFLTPKAVLEAFNSQGVIKKGNEGRIAL